MNRWSHILANNVRHTVMAVLVLAVSLTIGLTVAWLKLRSANTVRRGEIAQVEGVLSSFRESEAGMSLSDRLAQAQQEQARLQAEWGELSSRVGSIAGETPWPLGDPGATVEGRIDFKVALFNARTNLQELARLNHRAVPSGLGMQETIDTDEPAETRLWQLATVVRLLEGAIALGIPAIQDIEPLAPTVLVAEGALGPLGREFPVQLAMECSYADLLGLLDAMLGEWAALGMRRIYVRKPSPDFEELLEVQLVCTAPRLGMPDAGTEDEPEEEAFPDPLPVRPAPTGARQGGLPP